MKCPKCQTDNPDTVKFCGECGTNITSVEATLPALTKTIETPNGELIIGATVAGRYKIIDELGKGGTFAILGAGTGALAGIDKNIQIEDESDYERQETLEYLRKKARIPDYN